MDPGFVIQSEVSQKEKKQIPFANTYIWNLKKINGSDEPRSWTGIKTQT